MDRLIERQIIAWVEAAQAGDRAAFGRLVERYQTAVFVQCRRLASNRADAEDLAHDTFVQAYTQLRQLREPIRFGGWLKTIALNLYRSQLRRQYPPCVPIETDLPIEPETAPDGRWDRIEDNLWRLSSPQRLALALYYWEGLTYEEIARVVNAPVGTVMSRLHRARLNLKNGADAMDNGADEMNETPDLKKEIDAEIEALARLFAEDPESMERLSVLLEHAPARFARLIEEMAPAEVDPLTGLLKRLGVPAMSVALDCYFNGDEPVRGRALMLMRALVAQDREWYCDPNGAEEASRVHLTRTTYALLDRIIARAETDEAKAELLLALAEAARPGQIAGLYWKVMACYPRAALGLLRQRLEAREEVDVLVPSAAMRSLLRFGTSGCQLMIEWLDDARDDRQRLGWAGLAALGKGLNPRKGGGAAQTEKDRRDPRFRDYWPALDQDIDLAVLDALVERAVALTESADAEAREAAMACLSKMWCHIGPAVAALHRCLNHVERPTRLIALKYLGEIGLADDGRQIPELAQVEGRLVELAASVDRAERVAALTALGRLRFESSRSLLTTQAETADHAEIREAAVNGLGQIGGEESAALLRRLQVSGSKDLRKKASRWLQRLAKDEPQAPSPAQAARQRRLARSKEEPVGETPFGSSGFYSRLGAAVRVLPEIRAYPEVELTRHIALVCADYAYARRILADRGVLHREGGVCTLTAAGQGVWRVEHFIQDRYLVGI